MTLEELLNYWHYESINLKDEISRLRVAHTQFDLQYVSHLEGKLNQLTKCLNELKKLMNNEPDKPFTVKLEPRT